MRTRTTAAMMLLLLVQHPRRCSAGFKHAEIDTVVGCLGATQARRDSAASDMVPLE
jgi:hypothetical protein